MDNSFEIIPYTLNVLIPYNTLRPNKTINITGDLSLSVTGTKNGEGGIIIIKRTGEQKINLTGNIRGDLPTSNTVSLCYLHEPDGLSWYVNNPGEKAAAKYFVTVGVPGPIRNNYTGWLGMKITVGPKPITVTALSRYMIAGNNKKHQLRLVNSSNIVLSETTLIPGSGVGFADVPITPVILSPGGVYYILSEELNGGDQWYHLTNVIPSAVAAVDKAAKIDKSITYIYTTGVANQSYVPVNFKYY